MKNLLIYSDPNDPITKLLIDHQTEFDVDIVFLKDLLDHGTIFDKIHSHDVNISWEIFGKHIQSGQVNLINRVINVPITWFTDFDNPQYSQAEFYSYVLFALTVFGGKMGTDQTSSMLSSIPSLPIQWKEVGDHFPKIRTPEYYLGHKNFISQNWNFSEIIIANVYQFYDWKPNFFPDRNNELKNSVFAIQRPKGIPLLCFSSKLETCIHLFPDYLLSLSNPLKEILKQLAGEILSFFRYDFLETLFFIDQNEQITFGMSSPYLASAQYIGDFSAIISQSLTLQRQEKLKGC